MGCLSAPDGRAGIQLARDFLPNLILCDITMPEMDGFEVLRDLRSNPLTANIPFVFLTAQADRASLRQGMALGADDYVTKPFTSDELLAAIHTRLEKEPVWSTNIPTRQKNCGLRSFTGCRMNCERRCLEFWATHRWCARTILHR